MFDLSLLADIDENACYQDHDLEGLSEEWKRKLDAWIFSIEDDQWW